VFAACRGDGAAGDGIPAQVAGGRTAPGLLTDVRQVSTAGGWLMPRFSPDGRRLLVSGRKHTGFAVVDVAATGAEPRVWTTDAYLGWGATWTKDDGIATRTRDGKLLRFREEAGRIEPEVSGSFDPQAGEGPLGVRALDDEVTVLRNGVRERIAGGDDRWFHAVASPDGTAVACEGLSRGIRVIELADGRSVDIGRGNHAAWLPDSSGLVFDRTTDDGVKITAGDLWRWWRATGRTAALTATADRIETEPTVSPDGRFVAFMADGAVWIGTQP